MPGSTEYSMAPAGLSGVSKTVATTPTLVSNPITTAKLGDAYTNLPEVYKTQDFNEQDYRDKLLTTKYGTEASRRDKRKFNRYMKSEEGLAEMDQAKQAHTQSENQKWSQSLKARSQAMDQESARRREAMQAEWDAAVAQYDTNSAEIEAQDLTARIAGQARFGDAFRLARQSGLETFTWRGKSYGTKYATEVGTSGSAKRATTPTPTPTPAPAPKAEVKPVTANPVMPETPVSTSSSAQTPTATPASKPASKPATKVTSTNTGWTEQDFRSSPYFRDIYGGHKNRVLTIDGRTYPIMATTGLFGNPVVDNDHTYAFDPKTGMIRKVKESWIFGGPTVGGNNQFAQGSTWIDPRTINNPKLATPTGVNTGAGGGIAHRKQGGTMNRINYFQQGGAAPQQDIEAQVTALVQAAMQGDQKATQQVNQILEAAKAGDQQAMQIAQMIQQIVEQMQGQATAAKWGAKLGYIKSIKYAKGGKTCPACEKKVEMKACGGKKAKKRYFGGLI